MLAVGALVVLGAVSAWSALARDPEPAHAPASLAAPAEITSASPPVQWAAADGNRIAVAPRPTVVRDAAPAAQRPPVAPATPSAPAAETVPVVAPATVDDLRPTACPAPAAAPRPPVACPAPGPVADRRAVLPATAVPDVQRPAVGR